MISTKYIQITSMLYCCIISEFVVYWMWTILFFRDTDMGKIVKKQIEKITVEKKKFELWMKWSFLIEFANDSFGPYEYKFEREDCYFNDGLNDRGTKVFPLKNTQFDNTEIFLELDNIVVATGERGSLVWDWKTFVDIINISTEKKYRLFTDEVNLIYNTQSDIVINCKSEWEYKTFIIDMKELYVKETSDETLLTFFKCIYHVEQKKWSILDFTPSDDDEKDIEKKYKSGYFSLKKIDAQWTPKSFDREKFVVKTDGGEVDIWEESIQ